MAERDVEWRAGWDDAGDVHLDAALLVTPARRLAWLEAAIAFAYETGALPRSDDDA